MPLHSVNSYSLVNVFGSGVGAYIGSEVGMYIGSGEIHESLSSLMSV